MCRNLIRVQTCLWFDSVKKTLFLTSLVFTMQDHDGIWLSRQILGKIVIDIISEKEVRIRRNKNALTFQKPSIKAIMTVVIAFTMTTRVYEIRMSWEATRIARNWDNFSSKNRGKELTRVIIISR